MNNPNVHNKITSARPPAPDYDNVVSNLLLQSLDPLMEILRIHVTDYVLKIRKQLTTRQEFTTVSNASRKTGISVETIYIWIRKDLLKSFEIEGKKIVSLSEVKHLKQVVYQPSKSRKKISS